MASAWAGRPWIRCEPGAAGARRYRCPRNRFARYGRADSRTRRKDSVATQNPSREQILERIRAGLSVTVPTPTEAQPEAEFFAPVQNPMERFQQECKANLMECHLVPDPAAVAGTLTQVLQSLPEGEIYVQDNPGL